MINLIEGRLLVIQLIIIIALVILIIIEIDRIRSMKKIVNMYQNQVIVMLIAIIMIISLDLWELMSDILDKLSNLLRKKLGLDINDYIMFFGFFKHLFY